MAGACGWLEVDNGGDLLVVGCEKFFDEWKETIYHSVDDATSGGSLRGVGTTYTHFSEPSLEGVRAGNPFKLANSAE